ncbi:hypothetical protein OSB04_027525 [Centaurea solstitialis]|uniref:Isopenicillin N synthase-like Fe(2+) 2OG dioxygenase domain-containing protein n=1 Tax=Centaurea solstitialis TaxID=347529 RepID=A0AA38SDS0_9ASTR|nr:hypothetical protein OSB04_027525 [Centaurea solstitialis]
MSEMKSVTRPLFDLPVEIKRRNVDVFISSGYMAPSAINPLYESLGVYNMASPTDIEEFCSQMETITRYVQAIHQLLLTIAHKLLEGLGVVKSEPQFQDWPCHFRFNKYHFSSSSIGSGGVQFMTILHDDDLVDGLEVMDNSGNFVSVDPWPGTLVVNLSDMARVWSNGRFCNVRHRVQCSEATIRMSIASFMLGPGRGSLETALCLSRLPKAIFNKFNVNEVLK